MIIKSYGDITDEQSRDFLVWAKSVIRFGGLPKDSIGPKLANTRVCDLRENHIEGLRVWLAATPIVRDRLVENVYYNSSNWKVETKRSRQ